MHIVFGHVNNWNVLLIRILQFFKFKIFYLYVESKTKIQMEQIAERLRKHNIIPLPIEYEKEISTDSFYSSLTRDSFENAYKQNVRMVSDKILEKYCNIFSIKENKVNKIRLLIQDIIINQQIFLSSLIGIWSKLHPSKKIIFVSFKLKSLFISDVGSNITKIIIPVDVFKYFIKIFVKTFFPISIFKYKETKNKIVKKYNFDDIEKKTIAFVSHKGLKYNPSKENSLFDKTLYYSDDKDSSLNKYNILHLDYENFPSPDPNIYWVCLKKVKVPKVKIFFKTLFTSIKTLYLVRNGSTFLVWLLFIHQYNIYTKYCEIIKKFKNLKIAIIDYDFMCPKTLILALEKNNIRTVGAQERFIMTFYTSYNVMLDTYYVASEYVANVIKKSKYYDIKNIVPVGQYRSDYISKYKKGVVPDEILEAKTKGKKILIIFGHHPPNNWIESNIHPYLNWTAQINFLEDCIKLSQNLENVFIILRYKTLDWLNNQYFKNTLNKMSNYKNIIISKSYEESFYSYKLCAKADLVIAKYTSIADECLSKEIPVLFHEYTHNMKKIFLDIPNYLPTELLCHSFEDLFYKSKSILFSKSSKLMDTVKELNKKIYYVKEKGNIKNKIIGNLENLLNSIMTSQNRH